MLDLAYEVDADILQGNWYSFNANIRVEHIFSEGGRFSGYPWGKLYKYTVLENFCFPEGYWFEDTPISFIFAGIPYKIACLKDPVYGYRENPNGITATAQKDKKAIDSYWITEQCLLEFPDFGVSYDQRAYEYLLRQSLMNAGRVKNQPIKIQKAVFILTSALMKKYFCGFETSDKRMIAYEEALKNRQFYKFKLFLIGN